MKKVAIVQSNYIPWKGYFDMIAAVDEFIIFDDMQYTRRDWRNRNKIKTPQGVQWLTVPVQSKGKYLQSIRDTLIDGTEWAEQHWRTLAQNYRRAPYFDEVAALLEPVYLGEAPELLSELNVTLMHAICRYLGIETRFSYSWDYVVPPGKTERLVSLCLQAQANQYISGPAAKDYIDETLFTSSGIELSWFGYDGYPEYNQLWGEFRHDVSILDLLFNCGREAPKYMKYVAK